MHLTSSSVSFVLSSCSKLARGVVKRAFLHDFIVTLKHTMNVQQVAIVLLALVMSTGAQYAWDIEIDAVGNQASISLNGVKVLSHTKDEPCVYIGSGTTSFAEHHGNFDIQDYVNRRIPLDVVSQHGNSAIFTSTSDSSLRVTIDFQGDGPLYKMAFISGLPAGFDRLWLRFVADQDEKVFGGGEQFTYLDMRGRQFPIWTREQGVGRNKSSMVTFMADTAAGGAGGDYHTTYYGEPTFISSRGYLVHSTATWYTILDFRHETFHEIEIHGDVSEFLVIGGQNQTISEISQIYSKYAGLMPELPDWIYNGAIIGVQGGTQTMKDTLDLLEKHGVNVSALWIQDWAGKIRTSFGKRVFWNWEWNKEQYPDLDTEIPKLLERGVRVLVYINPYLNVEGDLYKEADQLGHFVKNSTGDTFISDFGEFYCGTIDLTKPEAVQWYKERIVKRLLDLGISGYMADFSEYLVVNDVKFYSGQSALELHNQWPRLWAKLNREVIEETNKLGDAVFWMRAGYAGVSNYSTLMWAGDQNVDYTKSDGLASTIPAALSMGLQGVGMTHFDVGGYTSLYGMIRTKELFLRSAEAAVFTPVMRTHEGNRPAENWQVYSDEDTMKQFARLVEMYKRLKSYVADSTQQYLNDGIPLQRPLFYQFPDDSGSLETHYQYMYGDDLMVAPVLEANVTEWECYIPPGGWIHLWSEQVFQGPSRASVSAPLGQAPVFYRKGSKYDWDKIKLPLVPPTTSTTASTSSTTASTEQPNRGTHSQGLWLITAVLFAITQITLA